MARVGKWKDFSEAVRNHLIERMNEREISLADLDKLRLWMEISPEVPEGEWYKGFGSFKLCGRGSLAVTFLVRGQVAKGKRLV